MGWALLILGLLVPVFVWLDAMVVCGCPTCELIRRSEPFFGADDCDETDKEA